MSLATQRSGALVKLFREAVHEGEFNAIDMPTLHSAQGIQPQGHRRYVSARHQRNAF